MAWFRPSLLITPLLIALVLLLVTALLHATRLHRVYRAHFAETRRERLFLGALGFFVTVAVVRSLTYSIHHSIGPFHDISLAGRHIHHLVWGILLLLLVGYGWLLKIGTGASGSMTWAGRVMAMLYGVGAALTLDEFALWLNLRDVYWAREGRASLEAMGMFGAFLTLSVLGASFFREAGREIHRRVRRRK